MFGAKVKHFLLAFLVTLMSEMAFTFPNGFLSSNSPLPTLPSDSSLDAYLTEPSPFSPKPSLTELAFSNGLPLFLEPLEVEAEDGQRENDSNPYHSIEDLSTNATTRFDPLLGSTQNSLVRSYSSDSLTVLESLSNKNSLISLGKFGDYDDFEDATLTLKDANSNSAETFSLTGKGYAEVLKDGKYEYVIFSGTDQTTSVQISAINDLKFGDFQGSSLKVQTQGSITAKEIKLQNTKASNSPGLILQSGLSEAPNTVASGNYKLSDLGTLLEGEYSYSYALDINNSGQVVGYSGLDWNSYHAFLYNDGQMTDLGTLSGGKYSQARGINDSGQITGVSTSSGSLGHAILYSNGQIIDLGTLMADGYSSANAINNSGQIVGEATAISNDNGYSWNHAFLYSNSYMKNLGLLPGKGHTSYANDINNSGQIVGYADFNNSTYHAILYSNGYMKSLGTLPGGIDSYAYAINDSGQVVGSSSLFQKGDNKWEDHAFLYSDGQMKDLGTLSGSSDSYAYDINNSGQVVGYSGQGWNSYRAFLYSDGQMTDLNSLIPSDSGWTLKEATAINDQGQIVGSGRIGGKTRAFVLTPIPFTSTPEDGITVGNISTLGDSISLQGLKITLTGEKVVSNGGQITLDAPTLLKSSTSELTFDSTVSADGSGGGDITFKKTLDGDIPNTQSLILKAGQGYVTFDQAVGTQTTLKDLTVNGAATVTAAGEVKIDGDMTFKVIDDIATANLTTNEEHKIEISLGKIDDQTFDSSGNVITGSITAKELKVLSNGGFTASGKLETQNGDIDIIALKDITLSEMTAQNGSISLISGTGAIAATAPIKSQKGLIALAKQDITTNKIESNQEAVILKSSQGAISVNDTISSNGDVSLAAVKDVVAQGITSGDGGVALMSASGKVQAQSAISSMEDVTLGANGDVVAQKITAQLGTVALVSLQGTVTTNEVIDGGIDVVISAKQDVSAGQILAGAVAIDSDQGAVTLSGNITTGGDSIYISARGNVVSQNLISQGGAITVVSEQAAVTTGYLRSDGYGTGGKIYLKAAGLIRVIGSFELGGNQYSIYTGTNPKKGSIVIVYQSNVLKKKSKTKFIIGDASLNGTVAQVSNLISFKNPQDPPSIPLLILEFIKSLFQGGPPSIEPTHVDKIDPITGEPYADEKEYELVKQLTPAQRWRLKELINKKTDKEELLEKEEFRKGKVDNEHGCLSIELGKHLGTYEPHTVYAAWVTGSNSDYLLIEPTKANYNFYDGEVKPGGKALLKGEPLKSLAEVKTDHKFLIKAVKGQTLTLIEQNSKKRLERQLYYGDLVAQKCGRKFFFSFDTNGVEQAAQQLYGTKYPMVKFHHIGPGYPDF